MKNEPENWDALYAKSGGICKSPYTKKLHEKVRDIIPIEVKTILDAGCGGGALMTFLSQGNKYEIEGVDLSPIGVRFVVEELNLKAQVADLCNLHQFSDNSFDLIVCSEVTEHLPTDIFKKVIGEMFRVSSKYVITTNPYKEQLLYHQLVCKECHTRYHPAGHVHSVSELLLRENIEEYAESLTFYYSGKKEWGSTIFAGLLQSRGYQLLGNMGTTCPVCGLPESSKTWPLPVRLLGYAHRAAQETMNKIGVHSHANILVMATVK